MSNVCRLIPLGSVCAAVLLGSQHSEAHHSFGMFDMTQCRTISGTVRKFEMVYPHSWLWIDVPGDNGGSEPWGFEAPSPTQLKHIDSKWGATVAAKGDKVTVKYAPLKDGRHGGEMGLLTLPNGVALVGSPGLCDPRPNSGTPTAERPAAPAK